MPLIYVNAPADTFSAASRDALADELTTAALECERLAAENEFVRSTTWIYFRDYPATHVYHGGKPGGTQVISLEINAFQGGLDAAAKEALFSRFTAAIRKHAGIADDALAPVYIVARDVSTIDWGVFGQTISLADLRNPAPGAQAI